jgi:hypothetical protein
VHALAGADVDDRSAVELGVLLEGEHEGLDVSGSWIVLVEAVFDVLWVDVGAHEGDRRVRATVEEEQGQLHPVDGLRGAEAGLVARVAGDELLEVGEVEQFGLVADVVAQFG